MVPSEDRKAIDTLYKASQPGIWQDAPTRIPVPGQGKQQRQASGSNPFSAIGKPNASKPKKQQGNTWASNNGIKNGMQPRRDRVNAPSTSERPNKRQKQEHHEVDAHIIDVDEMSTDDLNIPRMSSGSLASSSKTPIKYMVAEDGADTAALSEIEAFSSPTGSPPASNVQRLVRKFNKLDDVTPPRVNLLHGLEELKNRKAPKTGKNNPFTSKKRKSIQSFLPVLGWTAGSFSNVPCQLQWNRHTVTLMKDGNSLLEFQLDSIKSFEFTDPKQIGNATEVFAMIAIDSSSHIFLDLKDSDWSLDEYCNFIKSISKQTHLKPHMLTIDAATRMWEHIQPPKGRSTRSGQVTPFEIEEGTQSRDRQQTRGTIRIGSEPINVAQSSTSRTQSRSSSNPKAIPMAVSTGSSKSAREQLNSMPARRSTRQAVATKPAIDPDEVILVYPFGVPGAVNITNGDIARLEPGEFLNDTIIEFGLKLWLSRLEEANPALAEQVHVFSSFFYKKLNKKNIEEGYNSVRKWTSKFDIFKKKYVIVPINEHMHWYLALIYEPEHVLQPQSTVSNEPDRSATPAEVNQELEIIEKERGSEAEIEEDLTNMTQACSIVDDDDLYPNTTTMDVDLVDSTTSHRTPSPTLSYVEPEVSRAEIFRDSSPMMLSADVELVQPPPFVFEPPSNIESQAPESVDSEADILNIVAGPSEIPTESFYGGSTNVSAKHGKQKKGSKPKGRGRQSEAGVVGPQPNTTYVFTLDSLGTPHTYATRQLANYLKLEARDKKGIVTEANIVKKQAFVPTQPNYCDCGLYLLHLAQTFISKPSFYLEKSCTIDKAASNSQRQKEWHDEEVPAMREKLLDQIQQLSQDWKKKKGGKDKDKGKGKEADDPVSGPPQEDPASDSDGDIVIESISKPTKQKPKPKPTTTIQTRNTAARIR